jgi:hypothetical protein
MPAQALFGISVAFGFIARCAIRNHPQRKGGACMAP